MNRKVVYISDFFLEHIIGGGELNDNELINMLKQSKYNVIRKRSDLVNEEFLQSNKDSFFIISNFSNMNLKCLQILTDLEYIIYEHDHKYLSNRNPATYKNFKAPRHKIINFYFYKNAKRVFCQTNFHKDILQKNLSIDNITSVGGNLWSHDSLDLMEEFSNLKKIDRMSIMNSKISHKNTIGAVKYCKKNNIDYELIENKKYIDFLKKLGKNKKFIFLPKTPETLSRVVVEARMMNVSVTTNQLVGAAQEKWFELKGLELINFFRNKRKDILNLIESEIKRSKKQSRPKISIISTFYKGEKYLEGLLKDITNQTIFDECELILVDTASPGKEREIVKKYTDKYPNIRYYRYEKRTDPTVGTNLALEKVSSKYVTIANIDDRRSPMFLEENLKALSDSKNASLVYSDCIVTEIPNQTFAETKDDIVVDHSSLPFTRENMIKCLPGPMPLWDTIINEKCGFFNETYKFANDWEMWLRAVNQGYVFKKNDKKLGLYLSGGRSQQDFNKEQRREEAEIFFKFSNIFGDNYKKYYNYFDQFRRLQ